MLQTAYLYPGPALVRYPRGTGPGVAVDRATLPLEIGQGETRRRGRRVAILAFGSMVEPALAVAQRLDATLANMRFVKPLDEELVLSLADGHELLVTVEENALAGGAGSAVNECLAHQGRVVRTLNLGLPDRFIAQGTRDEQLAECGLNAAGILESVRAALGTQGVAAAGKP
jgi:1-deoxy-D-xylulose-5-phosphate synthase